MERRERRSGAKREGKKKRASKDALHERSIQILNEGLDKSHFFPGIFKDGPGENKRAIKESVLEGRYRQNDADAMALDRGEPQHGGLEKLGLGHFHLPV